MPEERQERLNMRLDPATRYYLDQLARRLNLRHTSVVRLLVRQECERRGIAAYDGEEA